MEPRALTPRYFVSAQIAPEDIPAIAAAGFASVICNRPDSEVPSELQAAAIRAAAEAAGLRFGVLELTTPTLTPENAARQRAMIDASDGKVLAYCRSGTRCSVIWALDQATRVPLDEVLATTEAAGYNLSAYLPLFEQVART